MRKCEHSKGVICFSFFFIGKTPHVISDRPMLLPRLGDLDYIAAWISMHLG